MTRAPETHGAGSRRPVTRVESQSDPADLRQRPASAPYQSGALPDELSSSLRRIAPRSRFLSVPLVQPVAGGGRGVASYQPPSAPIEATGSVTPPVPSPRPGRLEPRRRTPIIVGTSDTLDIIARRYNVPTSAILQRQQHVGPASASARPVRSSFRRRLASAPPCCSRAGSDCVRARHAPAARDAHGRQSGETLMRAVAPHTTHRCHRSPGQQPDSRPQRCLQPGTPASISRRAAQGRSRSSCAGARSRHLPRCAEAPRRSRRSTQRRRRSSPRRRPISPSSATGQRSAGCAEPVAKAADDHQRRCRPSAGRCAAASSRLTVPRPTASRMTASTSPFPKGTPIKAAEDGVVAYAGNELKGYGNLVLVRHANGYVSAYSHASELSVKRGDTDQARPEWSARPVRPAT